MHKLVLVCLALVAHVARGGDDVAKQQVIADSSTCQGPRGSYQPGERYCVDDTTSRVCGHGGAWVEHRCDVGKCKVYPDDPKKVECYQYNKVDYPTGPPAGFDTSGLVPVGKPQQRRRRNNDAMNKDAAGQAPVSPVQQDQQQPPQAAPAAPAKSDTCTGGPPGIDQPGDRYCVDEKTNRVCNWGGEWIEFKCEEDSKCQQLKTDPKKVQCFADRRQGYPTGAPAGAQADVAPAAPAAPAVPAGKEGPQQRRRRNTDTMNKDAAGQAPVSPAPVSPTPQDQPQAAPAAPAKSDTCTGGPPGIDQPGDRYCLDEKTSRVCNWGGEWVEFKCEEDSKCQQLKTDPKKVQCFADRRKGYPTGAPAGAQSDVAPAAPADAKP